MMMMMNKTALAALVLFFCAFTFTSDAQFRFKGDKDFRFYSDSLNDAIRASPPDFEKSNFQLCFYVLNFQGFSDQLYIFTHIRTGKWEIKKYLFCTNDMVKFSSLQAIAIQPTSLWVDRWNNLCNDGVLFLPSEKLVQKHWKSSQNKLTGFTEGDLYRIELLTKGEKRRYSYSNPESKLEIFDINNKELVAINRIVNILNDELDFKNTKNLQHCP
jgi:hypothetical protein